MADGSDEDKDPPRVADFDGIPSSATTDIADFSGRCRSNSNNDFIFEDGRSIAIVLEPECVENGNLLSSKKKRRLSNLHLTPDAPLRRSARRMAVSSSPSDSCLRLNQNVEIREKFDSEMRSCLEIKDEVLVLPPSSRDLEIDGLHVLDLFSVYSCLRSFSTLFFLSPFTLKAFVAALKCSTPNRLTDAIHYSILQALKPHLEALCTEGSEFASSCLRLEPPYSNLSCRYYNNNDVHGVLELLKSSYSSHDHIITSISKHLDIPDFSIKTSDISSCEVNQLNSCAASQTFSKSVSSLKDGSVEVANTTNEVKHVDLLIVPLDQGQEVPKGCHIYEALTDEFSKLPISVFEKSGDDYSLEKENQMVMQENQEICSNFDKKVSTCRKSKGSSQMLSEELSRYVNWYSFGRFASSIAKSINRTVSDSKNHYNLSADDIISAQLKEIFSLLTDQHWYSFQRLHGNVYKEVCGWCFRCKNDNEEECLLRVIETKILAGSRSRILNLNLRDIRKIHIFMVGHYILQIEDSLHGLLSGPWYNPYHKKQWRRNVLKAMDVTSLKYLLLTLELHLRRVALSSDWTRPVESSSKVGSGSYALPRPVYINPRQGVGKKKTRMNNVLSRNGTVSGLYPLTCFGSTSDSHWWRGGRLSRHVFNWDVLPRLLASKGGRQAGCKKIPGIIYPDGSEFARRSKYVAWRAAVEMSRTIAQLMYQVKELDSCIRWNDLSSSHPLPNIGKEYGKSSKQMWKAIICQKREDERHVSYLLDFGRKKSIPDVVTKHGALQESSSNEGRKYWLDESHIPVSLIKTFEARKLEKLMMVTNLEVFPDKDSCNMRNINREKGLSFLLSRGGNSDQYFCHHCGKLVRQREDVVSCRLGKGLIHKKNFQMTEGAATTIYTCFECKKNKLTGKIKEAKLPNRKKGKAKRLPVKHMEVSFDGQNLGIEYGASKRTSSRGKCGTKIADGIVENKKKLRVELRERKLERRPKKRQRLTVKRKILTVRKSERIAKKKKLIGRIKKLKARVKKSKKLHRKMDQQIVGPIMSKEPVKWYKGQRTSISPPFWLNGLMWTRKAFDERAVYFRERRILLPASNLETNLQPMCGLCHQAYDAQAIYIGCESCGVWFHGEAFALNLDNIKNLRGFKCHLCRNQSGPVCRYLNRTG
ncbi:PHD-finger and DNA binding domain-containing protein isoform X2 [Wolffia australiana]